MNPFLLAFDDRLRSWYELRTILQHSDLKTQCVGVDHCWQRAPQVNRHLHPDDSENWPDPWQLIADNNYYNIARGLGMAYTLALLGIKDIDFYIGKCYNDDITVITVDKYHLNHYPNSVLNCSLDEFTITKTINIVPLLQKLI